MLCVITVCIVKVVIRELVTLPYFVSPWSIYKIHRAKHVWDALGLDQNLGMVDITWSEE
jgi:hypothetical protein